MTDARPRSFWHRAGPLAALGALAAIAAAQGCSGPNETTSTTGDTTNISGNTSSGTSGSTSSGTSSTSGGSTGSGSEPSFNLGANGLSPFDTTPDPDGNTLYFTALSPGVDGELTAGVFSAPADGSSPTPTVVAVGDPFVSPFGISISADGKQLFVADPGAAAGQEKGAIFVVPVGGGTPTILAGTADAVPRGLDIVDENGKDVIYFTGTDKSDGQPGVFKIPVGGGAATVVAKGAPFRDPSGIAVAKNGTIYVADTIASGSETADILAVSGGTATQLLSGLRVGYPCGIALTMADTALLVSALDPVKLTDVVLNIDIASKAPSTIAPDTINKFSEAAGLHRARNADIFGWADSSAGQSGGGKVFVVK
jgi:hypothetical protein